MRKKLKKTVNIEQTKNQIKNLVLTVKNPELIAALVDLVNKNFPECKEYLDKLLLMK